MSCTTHRHAAGNASLQKALDGYIHGKTSAALEEFKRLTEVLEGEELARVYLYMGRCYINLGRMDAAADAFRMGRAINGAEPFDEYLQYIKNSFEASPKFIVRAGRVTRAQLTHLFSIYFAEYLSGGKTASVSYGKHGTRSTENEIDMIIDTGIMPYLPDGQFHGEAFVT